jgi:hypothetical protein
MMRVRARLLRSAMPEQLRPTTPKRAVPLALARTIALSSTVNRVPPSLSYRIAVPWELLNLITRFGLRLGLEHQESACANSSPTCHSTLPATLRARSRSSSAFRPEPMSFNRRSLHQSKGSGNAIAVVLDTTPVMRPGAVAPTISPSAISTLARVRTGGGSAPRRIPATGRPNSSSRPNEARKCPRPGGSQRCRRSPLGAPAARR